MTNPYDNDKRLLELLERWQSGEFTRADEQELQLLTASDDFRRESAEGFMSAPETDHSRHLASLRSRLRNRSGTAKRVMLPQLLAAVAAAGALILAVVWLMPTQNRTGLSEESIAAPSEQMPAEKPMQDTSEQDLAAAPVPQQKEGPGFGKTSAGSPKTAAPDPVGNVSTMSAADDADGVAFQEAQPGAVSTVPAPATEGGTKNMDLAAESVEMEEAKALPLEKSMAKKKESRALPSSAPSGAQPAGGWNAFNEYLRKNARLPEQARQNNVSGVVRIRFELDANSKPSNFRVIKSLGFGCDEAAQQLIQQYSWQAGQNNELTVDVPFVR